MKTIKVSSDYYYHTYFGGIYFHGELEERLGYDLCGLCNPEDFEEIKFIDHNTGDIVDILPRFELDGEYPCEVEGIEEPCTAFIWTIHTGDMRIYHSDDDVYLIDSVIQKGLIVLNSDTESVNYARKARNSRRKTI